MKGHMPPPPMPDAGGTAPACSGLLVRLMPLPAHSRGSSASEGGGLAPWITIHPAVD